MKVFISSDIEGTTGINHWDETRHGNPDITYFMKQMTREVNAVCQGAIAAGAESILVKDGHATGRNLLPEGLPEEVKLLRGWTGDPYSMMGGINTQDFDAVMFTGYHSWTNNGGNPLSHSKNTKHMGIIINGVVASEFMINSYTAGMLGIPVCFLSGDKAMCQYAESFIPGLKTVAVNEGIGGATISIHPDLAVRRLKETAQAALSGDYKSCRVPMPKEFEVIIRYKEHTLAYTKSFFPNAALVNDTDVRLVTKDYFDVLRLIQFGF